MFKELVSNSNNERPVLSGTYNGRFLGVVERQRATFETRNDPEPELEDVFVFEFEIEDEELPYPILVAKWVRKPSRLTHPKNGKVTNLYRVLASLYGVTQMTDQQLEDAEEFVQSAVGRGISINNRNEAKWMVRDHPHRARTTNATAKGGSGH